MTITDARQFSRATASACRLSIFDEPNQPTQNSSHCNSRPGYHAGGAPVF